MKESQGSLTLRFYAAVNVFPVEGEAPQTLGGYVRNIVYKSVVEGEGRQQGVKAVGAAFGIAKGDKRNVIKQTEDRPMEGVGYEQPA